MKAPLFSASWPVAASGSASRRRSASIRRQYDDEASAEE
jgi:hypothetical protein